MLETLLPSALLLLVAGAIEATSATINNSIQQRQMMEYLPRDHMNGTRCKEGYTCMVIKFVIYLFPNQEFIHFIVLSNLLHSTTKSVAPWAAVTCGRLLVRQRQPTPPTSPTTFSISL